MNFDRINEQLQKIKTTKKIEDIHALIGFLTEPLGVRECEFQRLFMHASVQREVSRFMPAQGFRNQAAAYTIPHQSGIPLDIKLFWMKKTTKANLSWVMALTPNYEDNPETNVNLNIGMDIVVSENCDSVFIVFSNNLKARVLELNGSLSLTQQEIFDNWVKIGRTVNRDSENFKKELHTLLWKSFDFEPINRKFYLQLVEQFDHLVGHLKKNIAEESAKMFAVRLIGRTLFLWFLRKKEFVNPEFDYFTVSGDADQTQYYREKLEPLFFEVLNTEIKDRSFTDKITPFLNGGLFEPIDTDFYKDSKLTFPTGFFTQFFNVLNHYNFTVDEGTSEYEQVAVDPEMLGRVFENLLASLNDETGNQARKSKGAFYTPREIVDYMCEQSLVEYLKTKLPDTANRDRRIEELVTMDEASFREQDHNKRRDWKKDLGQEQVVQALDALKILDPAVGSGAFPMGMLNLLVKVYTRIDTAREKDLAQLKRDILSRSLYGVDIDQMAIQISRLRAWLSILVDMENLKKAEPLPNLDFKFVCANTLIPLDDGSNGLFDGDVNLKDNLIKLRDQYYAATRKIDKEKIRKEYLKLINTGSLFASQRELQLKDYNPFNPLNSSGFYDPTLMHGVEAFDVLIGNPPYIRVHKIKTVFKKKFSEVYKSAKSDYDLYVLFFEKSFSILTQNGLVSFITPDKYLTRDYGDELRKIILTRKIIEFFDLSRAVDVFNASTYPLISIISNIASNASVKIKIATSVENLKSNFSSLLLDRSELVLKNKIEIYNDDTDTIISKVYSSSKIMSEYISSDDIFCGTPRAKDYHEWGKYVSGENSQGSLPLIVCGNISPYTINLNKNIRVLGNKITKAYLNNCDKIMSQNRYRDFSYYPKILIRGNDKRLTAVLDQVGFAFIGVYAIKIPAEKFNVYLGMLGQLNSKLFQYIFKKKNPSIMISGGYFSINSPHILALPYKEVSTDSKLISLVQEINKLKNNDSGVDISNLESQVDELVMDLYGLNEQEKEIIRNS